MADIPEGFEIAGGGIPEGFEAVEPETSGKEVSQMLMDIPGMPAIAEFASGVNRSVLDVAELGDTLNPLGTKKINALLELMGSDKRIPSPSQLASPGGFMEEGLMRDVVSAAGEVLPAAAGGGALLRSAAQSLPAVSAGVESVGANLLRQAGSTTAVQDIALGAASGAGQALGQEAGGDAGAMAGAILAPIGAQTGQAALKGLAGLGAKGFATLARSVESLSDDGAAELISQAMVREGVSPDELAARLAQLGPEALPADLGNNFARLLRLASNKVPRIEGAAADKLRLRHGGQSDRIIDALDDASGTSRLTIGDEIERLNTVLGPKIKELYQATSETPLHASPKLRSLLEGNNSVGRAAKKAQLRLADKRAVGDQIGNMDLIDATKQQLDDQIGKALRQGENNTVRDLVRLKNVMVGEADAAVPTYKQARDLYAGKAQLESAADAGEMFFKMKPREMSDFTKTYGDSEKKMFKLGAKQAIMDKIDSLQTNADAVKRMFGRNGDVKKLRMLFDDEQSFNNFSDALEREAQFVLTRRAAQGNSTTAQQLADQGNAAEALGEAFSLLGNPIQSASAFGRILSGLSGKKSDAVFTQSLEKAGDILLESGMNPGRLRGMLRAGNANQIEQALRKVMINPVNRVTPASIGGGAQTALTLPEQTQRQRRQQ